ncbi:DUF6270 domain-containing protein [Leuconostoc carnosum]|uniref:DUF6270 domain-containing protein n=1 Tax=Leuconostoc carnosum TaxID=1252 RepID=UPI00345E5D01
MKIIGLSIDTNSIKIKVDKTDENTKNIYFSSKISNKRTYWTEIQRIYPLIQNNEIVFNLTAYNLKKTRWLQLRGISDISVDVNNDHIVSKNPLVITLSRKKFSSGHIKRLNLLTYAYQGNHPIVAYKRLDLRYINPDLTRKFNIPVNRDGEIIIDLPAMAKALLLRDRDYVDFYEVDVNGVRHLLPISETIRSEFSVKQNIKFIEYNANGYLGMRVAAQVRLYVKNIELVDKNLEITVDKNSLENITRVYLVETNQDFSDSNNSYPLIFEIRNKQIVLLNFREIFESIFENRLKCQYVLRFEKNDDVVAGTLKFSKDNLKTRSEKIRVYGTTNYVNDYVFNIDSRMRNETVSIAIHGSSQTRGVLVSSSYYNPDYKNYFKASFMQHHGSIRAMVNDVQFEWKPQYFISPEVKPLRPSIQRDIQKTFFKDLKNANADFLLIDIYSDVQMGVVEIEGGGELTYTMSQVESDYLAEEICQKMTISSLRNDPNYRQKFLKSLKIYRKRILEIFDESQIIIHAFELNYEYSGIDGKTHAYDNPSKADITMTNYFAVQLQSDLINMFPKAAVIDSRRWHWIGDERMPTGNIPHHFQSERYRFFLSELAKIIAQRQKHKN